ncbi:Lrp/AsnC family transcriptional regulator [uncultured Flavobacterium sp.]|uniref:Lrp/AsnC family transcriptional regulator n=1 Tax=uncultured Flavobacterium sp. TaxID=165435 RepID=UPI0030CA2BE4|tara:strand:+ start:1908 stop:2384 length:477 start_codon:yes stop_codon:yes gene_type:complete
MKDQIDLKDQLILEILQQNSSLSVKEIGERIGLSFTPTYERIKNLENNTVIKKYVALVDPLKIGIDLVAYCNITLKEQSRDALIDFEKLVNEIDEIQEMFSLSGNYDYMLRIVAKDVKSYNEFVVSVISNIPNIGLYHSSIVLKEVKRNTAFILPALD